VTSAGCVVGSAKFIPPVIYPEMQDGNVTTAVFCEPKGLEVDSNNTILIANSASNCLNMQATAYASSPTAR